MKKEQKEVTAKYYKRRREAGEERKSVWMRDEWLPLVQKYIEKLRKKPRK